MANTLTVYGYDPNGWYTGPCIAQQSPLDRGVVWLYPANSTPIAPPQPQNNLFPKFNKQTNAWSLVAR